MIEVKISRRAVLNALYRVAYNRDCNLCALFVGEDNTFIRSRLPPLNKASKKGGGAGLVNLRRKYKSKGGKVT